MARGLLSPHVLLAGSNPNKLIENLKGTLSERQLKIIQKAVDKSVSELFQLGLSHYNFAITIPNSEWRQRISRLYYAAYNIKRSIALRYSGQFSTDSSDHQRFNEIPDGFNNAATYRTQFKVLRDDRNLADYSHVASESDLLISVVDAEALVTAFIADSRSFLKNLGVSI